MNSLQRVGRKRLVDGDDERRRRHHRDRHEILVGIVVDLGGQRRQRQQRDRRRTTACSRRLGVRHVGGADDAARADLVLHDEGLLEGDVQALGRDPRHHVGDAAGRIGNDQRDGPVGPCRLGGTAASNEAPIRRATEICAAFAEPFPDMSDTSDLSCRLSQAPCHPARADVSARMAAMTAASGAGAYTSCTSSTPGTALMAPAICGETLKRPGSFTSTSAPPPSCSTMLISPSPLPSSRLATGSIGAWSRRNTRRPFCSFEAA